MARLASSSSARFLAAIINLYFWYVVIVDQAMSTASGGLAEAYMKRKLHKEKMKRSMESTYNNKQKSSQLEKADSGTASASGGGCFSMLMFKKIHPKR
ncbi:hypothetical protein BUALT_Bualt08G0023900 [Buddleja alternifolia]|uniref:Uncharacterized protein n=1 Tax=Buddleja alternifolia TaxID=168488 RepID=A0AAV6X4P3_9LAMI|nr:hypothetical protein BUALT_Bualt08G0023900 [Buddleja alternifolia]